MMNILILEDDVLQLQTLHTLLDKRYKDFCYTCCQTYDEAVEALHICAFDIFILDIRLTEADDNQDGIHFAETVRRLPAYRTVPILFLTAYPEHMSSCINGLHCYSYLIKPYNVYELLEAIENIVINRTVYENHCSVVIKLLNDVTTYIPCTDILYIEVEGHVCSIVCTNGSRLTTRTSLKTLYERLPQNFIQCHKKYVVNKSNITSYDKSNLYVHLSDCIVPVGRTFKKEFEENSGL